MILKYCDMFLKLKDLCDSPTFKEVDMNNDGSVFPKDFKAQLEKSKKYIPDDVGTSVQSRIHLSSNTRPLK